MGTNLLEGSLAKCSNFKVDTSLEDFPGGSVVKNPPASAEDMHSIPGPGRLHVLWSK